MVPCDASEASGGCRQPREGPIVAVRSDVPPSLPLAGALYGARSFCASAALSSIAWDMQAYSRGHEDVCGSIVVCSNCANALTALYY